MPKEIKDEYSGLDLTPTQRWRKRNPDKIKTIGRNYKRKRYVKGIDKAKRQRRKYWIDKYKVAKGCEICGYNQAAVALDFDHINSKDKEFGIGECFGTNYSLKRMFKEIRKCQILCANCHRIKSGKEVANKYNETN